MNVELSEVFSSDYNEFIKNKYCTFYQSYKHLKFLERILKIKTKFILAKEENKLVGILPFF